MHQCYLVGLFLSLEKYKNNCLNLTIKYWKYWSVSISKSSKHAPFQGKNTIYLWTDFIQSVTAFGLAESWAVVGGKFINSSNCIEIV